MFEKAENNAKERTDTGIAENDRTSTKVISEYLCLREVQPIVDVDVFLSHEYHAVRLMQGKQCIPESPLAYADDARSLTGRKCLSVAPPFLHEVRPVRIVAASPGSTGTRAAIVVERCAHRECDRRIVDEGVVVVPGELESDR